MKVLMNGHNSVQLTPVWPVMRGYGEVPENLYDEPMPPHAGPNGSYTPEWRDQLTAVPKRPRAASKRTPLTYQLPQDRPQATPKTAVVTGTTLPAPGSESGAPGAPEGTSEATPLAPPTHPYSTPSAAGPETVTGTGEGTELPPSEDLEDAGGGGGYEPPAMALQTEDYVGGSEIGPEGGNGVVVTTLEEKKKSRWPIYVGIGAGALTLGLVGLAVAYSGKRR